MLRQCARGTNDDRLTATQEDLQALLFDWRMETADDAGAGFAPLGGLIVSGEDDFAWAASGTKQRRLGQGEQVEVAESR